MLPRTSFSQRRGQAGIARGESVCEFREAEGVTVVIDRSRADSLKLDYDFVYFQLKMFIFIVFLYFLNVFL